MMMPYSFFRGFLNLIIVIFIFHLGVSNLQSSEPEIKIHYLGHSAFVLQFDNGITIVTDYGHYNAWVDWGWDSPIYSIGNLVPDVMTYSHHHDDHYDRDRIPENISHIITGLDSLSIDGIEIKPVRTCEDSIQVESNTSYIFIYKGVKICHLGDAQVQIMNIDSNEYVRNHIKTIFPDTFDLLLMTIEGKQKFIPQAEAFIDLLQPRRIIPMHFWSQTYKEDFLDYLRTQNDTGKKYQIQVSDGSDYELYVSEDTDSIKVIVLTPTPFH
jgi:L-ascorbate metabolism protein UlaG (beta-lactamase superfamily)